MANGMLSLLSVPPFASLTHRGLLGQQLASAHRRSRPQQIFALSRVLSRRMVFVCRRNHSICRPPPLLALGRVACTPVPTCKDGWECDWESMTDEEFKGFLTTLERTSNGVPASRFVTIEEYEAFKKRSGRYLVLVSEELSSLFKGVDLITPLKARKGCDDEAIDDEESNDAPFNFSSYVKEEASNANKSKRSM